MSYTLFLFSTPFIVASVLLSTGYIFLYRPSSAETVPNLPSYPDLR